MFIDFRTLSDGSLLQADLCIIGAGAAGITIAREFTGSDVEICLVESGGFEIDSEIQALYEGENIGLPYFDLDLARLRFFGGTTNHWGGWCRPLDAADFEARRHIPDSGWPISKTDLDPFYERAHEIVEIGPAVYDERYWVGRRNPPPKFNRDLLQIDLWRFSPPTRFGEVYRDDLDKAGNVKVLTYANAMNIQANATASAVDYVELRSPTGTKGRVVAKFFVLACGGLENPRLLLLSNSVEARGLGNRHDLVGRFFMEHPHVISGIAISDAAGDLAETFDYHDWPDSHVRGRPSISISRRLQEVKEVLTATARLDPVADLESGSYAAREIWRELGEGRMATDFATKVWRIVKDLDEVAADAYGKIFYGTAALSSIKRIDLHVVSEQMPNPESRVSLSTERDQLGLNRIRLDWRLTETDKRTIAELATAIGQELGRLNIGRVKLADWLMETGTAWPETLGGGNHHMGTTRMSSDPKRGVVDSDCRVHGIHNLFISGSSIFPTSGFAAPTMNIVALALRLAEHLKRRMG
jgi:choline dehydrogenase-like flavoprotein